MGDYRLLRQISSPGAWLETWSGRVVGSDRTVLLKRVGAARGNGLMVDRLAALATTPRVPGAPALIEVGFQKEETWLVYAAAEGETLRWVMSTLARAAGFIAPNEGIAVVMRAASTLAAMHKLQQVHGDVCPSTLLLSPRGDVQLCDGGVAASVGSTTELGPIRSEGIALAPEQLDDAATAASDVFRLGQVLFELSLGRPLWAAPSHEKLVEQVRAFTGLNRDKVKHVPEPWLTLLVSMLSVDPAARPSVEEALGVLTLAVKQQGWPVGDDDIGRLFARASQSRMPWFGPPIGPVKELSLQVLATGLDAPSIAVEPPTLTPPGAVVARIATRKMTLDELKAVRAETPKETEAQTPELRAAMSLVEKGQLTQPQVQLAREKSASGQVHLFVSLVESGADEDLLISAWGELTRVPTISSKRLFEAQPGPELLGMVPWLLAKETKAAVIGMRGTQVVVAMLDPMDERALSSLKSALAPRSVMALKGGDRALNDTWKRLYPDASDAWRGEIELDSFSGIPMSTPSRPMMFDTSQIDVSSRIVETLLSLQGARGAQGKQIVGLAEGLARRLGHDADVSLARMVAQGFVAAALANNKLPHEVPNSLEMQELFGFGTVMDEFADALHQFPARMPERVVVKAVVIAFAFAAHSGEAHPIGSRAGGALSSFRSKVGLAPTLLDALTREVTG